MRNNKSDDNLLYAVQCMDGSYSFEIDDLTLPSKKLDNCVHIIDTLTKNDDLYFGFFRGESAWSKQQLQYNNLILEYFRKHGEYHPIFFDNGKARLNYLTVAKAPKNKELLNLMPYILFFSECTTIFSPKVSFKTFKNEYSDYMQSGTKGYISKGFLTIFFIVPIQEIFLYLLTLKKTILKISRMKLKK